MKHALGFLVFVTISAVAMQSAKADVLQVYDGSWRGEGWAVQSPGAKRENIKCRLRASYIPPSKRLVVRGKCAVPGRKFDLKGTVSEKTGEVIAGRWSNPFGPGSTAVNGKASKDGLTLDLSAPEKRGGKRQPHRLIWSRTNGGFTLVSRNLAAGETVSSVTFRR